MNVPVQRATLLGGLLAMLSFTSSAVAGPSHTDFDRLLQKYVVDDRYVQYDLWHANEEDNSSLGEYIRRLEGVDPKNLTRDEAMAYWINLYNAVTLELILDHFPVESIKDLGGKLSSPWGKELVTVNGQALSLNKIENEIIRPTFADPRIHFALNCASVGCPPLASRAYVGQKIEAQLEEVARRTMANSYWVDLSRCGTYGKGSIKLSKLFDWYQDDFGGADGLRNFLGHYLPAKKLALQNGGCSLDYNDYDWKLNLPPGKPKSR
jgi:Protein of unknown function, DUF547